MNIIIGGDLCPINSNEKPFINGISGDVFNNFSQIISGADLSIFNLEGPLTNEKIKIKKSGPNLKAQPETINAMKDAGIKLLSLANNHMGDYGEQGVFDTIDECSKYDIKTVGAGCNNIQSRVPYIYQKGTKVGILSFADTEFGMATVNTAGANPFILSDCVIDILKLKRQVDYIIVLLHDGKEHYPYPSPELQKNCRFLVDIGVNLVVCQHSHIIGAWEEYKKSNIFYGQGNFIFDYDNRYNKSWSLGYLIELKLVNGKGALSVMPFKQSYPGIQRLNELENKEFIKNMNKMKLDVKNETYIKNQWENFIKKFESTYYSALRGNNKLTRKLNSFLPIYKFIYNKNKNTYLENIIRSRVHREVILDIIKRRINK